MLLETSAAVDKSSSLATAARNGGHIPTLMCKLHQTHLSRNITGSTVDLGAFEYGSGGSENTFLLFLPAILSENEK